MINAIFISLVCFIVMLVVSYLIDEQLKRDELPDEPIDQTDIDAVLNSKVPKERGFMAVKFGSYIIQLSFEEWLKWNTWTRRRRRVFVQEFKKAQQKGQVKKSV